MIRSLIFAALVATFTLPTLAAIRLMADGGTATQEQQDQAKADLYKKFTDNRNTNPQVAYDAGKEYLTKYGSDNDQYVAYIKKWVAKYEAVMRMQTLAQNIQQSKFADAFTLAKQILADDPNNLTALWSSAIAGLNLVTTGQGTDAINTEGAANARHAIDLINQGGTFVANTPLSADDRDKTLGLLNYALGIFNYKNAPADAIKYFIEVTKHNIPQKTEPQTFFLLASAYENAYYKRMAQEYQTKFPTVGAEQTPEGQLAKANLNEVINRVIDAYARAINLAGNNPKYAQQKPAWLQTLTGYYKYAHNDSDAGLNDMISSIQSKPLPPAYTPLTSLPVNATTPATPATGGTTPATGGTTPSTTPSGTTPAQPANRTNTNTNTNTTPPNTNTNSNTSRPPSTTSSNSSRTTTNSRRPRR
ncbi:MAG: hypothetical protein AUG51_20045 [Acidobacteria bacterium 13_1_20CM_3_53_8]|nr:MAG: hypothetical protein AUG51_20045 [Acidobacteria bacterium 13_1_20CM_3_53_8]